MSGERRRAQNSKMVGTPIVMCPEIERADRCIYFGKGLCPNCYAERLWPLRRHSWKGKAKTPPTGLIRLGTWREILPDDYEKFKSMFPQRHFFLITRGLLPLAFYEKVNSDPFCVNLQVSVDVIGNEVIPSEEKLSKLARLSKVLFRFKTLDENVNIFIDLARRLGIPFYRILETPLRLPGGCKLYDPTPMSKKLPSNLFFRCNTKCADCSKENGVLVCAINPEKLKPLQKHAPEQSSVESTTGTGL
jgi:hypothetical protein